MSNLTFARPTFSLPSGVADFAVERHRRTGHPLPQFRVGDQVRDRETGGRGHVASILKTGHLGEPLLLIVFRMGIRVTVPHTRLEHAGPPKRVPCA